MTAGSTTAIDVVGAFFTAFGSGDLDELSALFADDAEAVVQGSPRVPWTGVWSGRARVREFLATCLHTVQPQRFDVAAVRTVDDGSALVTGAFEHLVTATGRTFTSQFALLVEARDGLIERYVMFENSWAVDAAF